MKILNIAATVIKVSILVAFVYTFFIASAYASIYKCEDENGNIEYTDKACSNPLPIENNVSVFKDNGLRDSEKELLDRYEREQMYKDITRSGIMFNIITIKPPKGY